MTANVAGISDLLPPIEESKRSLDALTTEREGALSRLCRTRSRAAITVSGNASY
jgi:hypothetical protein